MISFCTRTCRPLWCELAVLEWLLHGWAAAWHQLLVYQCQTKQILKAWLPPRASVLNYKTVEPSRSQNNFVKSCGMLWSWTIWGLWLWFPTTIAHSTRHVSFIKLYSSPLNLGWRFLLTLLCWVHKCNSAAHFCRFYLLKKAASTSTYSLSPLTPGWLPAHHVL